MRGLTIFFLFTTLIFGIPPLDSAAATQQYVLTIDPQALAIAQAALAAMGGNQVLAAYQDSVASGTATVYTDGNQVSYPIIMKSKGLRETRVELQTTKGTNIRIVNQGQGAIIKPNGTVKNLYSNNTFPEHVNHIPLLSVLAEISNGSVNVLYKGTARIQAQSEDVIEIDFVPTLMNGAMLASMSRASFFVNQTTKLVDKIQRATFYEGDDKNTFNEETYFTNYHSVNGMLVPYHVSVFVDGKLDTDIAITALNVNVGLLDTDFALPAGR
jgi:hypothetical protein